MSCIFCRGLGIRVNREYLIYVYIYIGSGFGVGREYGNLFHRGSGSRGSKE